MRSVVTFPFFWKRRFYRKILCLYSVCVDGFVLDQHMHKMSKSLGNVIEPFDLISGAFDCSSSPCVYCKCMHMRACV